MTEQRANYNVNGSDVSLTTGHADSGDYTWDDGDELADLAPHMTNDEYTLLLEQKLQDAATRLAAYERNGEGMTVAAWVTISVLFWLGALVGYALHPTISRGLAYLLTAVLP